MKLVWLGRALRERDSQLDYIAQHKPRAAIAQGERIQKQVQDLCAYPELGRPGRVHGTRELLINGTPFILVYRINPAAGRIEILRLLHGAQQWPPV
ncbi:type II toxin-antitoxin system RelE/ParE family toxin [Massilia sp. W12]|uniref:type II toxin-antitoxin system RelE/ParE family toxin n=1 Tax=Massilia sp. W12 TaxID=3126507 RepID=UPI0030D4E3B0